MMNVPLFNQLTLPEQVVLIPLKGRFIAQRQNNNDQIKLYYWSDHFVEIYYRWPAQRGLGANWEPYEVVTFIDQTGCTEQLMNYVDQLNLDELLA
jgi:hypothetical protein